MLLPILVVDYELSCFADDAELVGSFLDKSFTLRLNDAAYLDAACLSSKSRPAELKLIFNHNANMVYIKTEMDYSYEKGPYSVQFYHVDSATVCLEDGNANCYPYGGLSSGIFDYLQAQSVISYTVLLLGSVPNHGGLNTIRSTKMNATNCWDNLRLYYDIANGFEEVYVIGSPLECDVQNPTVKFYFRQGNAWKEFPILGDASYNASCYCAGRAGFDFQQTTCYRQELKLLSNVDDAASFKLFLEEFRKNLLLRMRLVVLTQVAGSSMKQTVISNINQHDTINQACLVGMQPRMHFTADSIYIRMAPGLYSPANCVYNGARTELAVVIYNESTKIVLQTMDYSMQEFLAQILHILPSDYTEQVYKEMKMTNFQAILRVYGADGKTLMGASYRDIIYYSCLDFVYFHFNSGEVCLDLAFSGAARCTFENPILAGVYLGTQDSGYTSLTTYFSYLINISYSPVRQMFCTNQTVDQHLNQPAEGDARARIRAFKQKVASDGSHVVAQYIGIRECIYRNLVILDDKMVLIIAMILVSCVIGVGTVAWGVYLIVKELQK